MNNKYLRKKEKKITVTSHQSRAASEDQITHTNSISGATDRGHVIACEFLPSFGRNSFSGY